MPSPVGHALGGVLFGWLLGGAPDADPGQPRGRSEQPGDVAAHGVPEGPWRVGCRAARRVILHPSTVGFALLGMAPDVDFLAGLHSQHSHSVGAIALVFLVAAVWGGGLDMRRGLACAAAYGSHVLLDWLGSDTVAPIGIMALWPIDAGFHQSDVHLFMGIRREYWLWSAWTHNLIALIREVALLVPLMALVWWWRRPSWRGEGRVVASRARRLASAELPAPTARESA